MQNLGSMLIHQPRLFCAQRSNRQGNDMPLKGPSPTDDADFKPVRSGGTDRADIGGKPRDISKDVDRWSKLRGGKSGKC
jgi:hypothetical protein